MRYISLFSGIEAASVAWGHLGWEPVAFSEIDPFPCELLKQRFPSVPNLGDITKINWNEVVKTYGAVDLVVGGSPCQSFSVAGSRAGLDGESGLMWEYVRAVRELRSRYVLWENVTGALSSCTRETAKGDDFRCLLSALDDLGYGLAWRVLDAQFFGVAQRRRRIFLFGCLGDPWSAAKILFEPEILRGDNPSSREKRAQLTEGTTRGVGVSHSALPIDTTQITSSQNRSNPQWGDPCHPICTQGHTPAVCIGFSAGQSAKAGSIAAQEEIASTLRAAESGTNQVPSVAYAIAGNIIGREPENGGHHLGIEDDGACFTLTATDRHAVAFTYNTGAMMSVSEELTPTIRSTRSGEPAVCMASGQANAETMDECCPIQSSRQYKDPPIVALSNGDDVCGALCARDYKGIGSQYVNEGKVIAVEDGNGYIVRRLMPIECERLQGFPDGWTDLGGTADAPRYKALGNSMAVPVMRWIGERIQLIESLKEQ